LIMATILDYLDWRGDITFSERPFNEVDNLILAELAFLDFQYTPESCEAESLTLASMIPTAISSKGTRDMGVLVPDLIPNLAEKVAVSKRFCDVLVPSQVNHIDESISEQFSATTFLLPNEMLYVAFRGTDDTIAGWHEDFNMGIMSEIPSQYSALQYLETIAHKYPNYSIMVGGHSKGGNLAVYASVFCPVEIQNRIIAVYNNDGPGFLNSILETDEHRRIADRITTILPEASVVGMLLEHEAKYKIVPSTYVGLFQHDGFSWQLLGTQFVELPELSDAGKIQQKAIHDFIKGLDMKQRVEFINTFFEILECTDARTLTDLKNGGSKTAGIMLGKLRGLDKETRHFMIHLTRSFLSIGAKSAVDEFTPQINQRYLSLRTQLREAIESIEIPNLLNQK